MSFALFHFRECLHALETDEARGMPLSHCVRPFERSFARVDCPATPLALNRGHDTS